MPLKRRLGVELLENRRLLAGIEVGNKSDDVNGDCSSIDALIAAPGADGISLREAVMAANQTDGADTITFNSALSGQTISLSGGEIIISQALTIDARPLAANVTIDAHLDSRIFNIFSGTGDVLIGGLNLTRGAATADGGAIRSGATNLLTLSSSEISGSVTHGDFAPGGGISTFGSVLLEQSTVRNNFTTGFGSAGGGIFAGERVTLIESTISGNGTTGVSAAGGGIHAQGGATLVQSTVSGNYSEAGNGGGIWASYDSILIEHSTITKNFGVSGGGVFQGDTGVNAAFTLSGSIIAFNQGGSDLVKDPDSTLTVNYCLIGIADGLTFAGNVGNHTGTGAHPLDPRLSPLGHHGGPTKTHVLWADSPAVNSGDYSIVYTPSDFDQRGIPFPRIWGGRIDIGAVETHLSPALPGDYNLDDVVDAADYVLWRKTLGSAQLSPYGAADGSGDGEITDDDYTIWIDNFGNRGFIWSQIGGSVSFDVTQNGLRDASDLGIESVEILLTGTDFSGTEVNQTILTNRDGYFLFTGLKPGTYRLLEGGLQGGIPTTVQPAGFMDGPEAFQLPLTSLGNDEAIFTIPSFGGVSSLSNEFMESGLEAQFARVGFLSQEDEDAVRVGIGPDDTHNWSVFTGSPWQGFENARLTIINEFVVNDRTHMIATLTVFDTRQGNDVAVTMNSSTNPRFIYIKEFGTTVCLFRGVPAELGLTGASATAMSVDVAREFQRHAELVDAVMSAPVSATDSVKTADIHRYHVRGLGNMNRTHESSRNNQVQLIADRSHAPTIGWPVIEHGSTAASEVSIDSEVLVFAFDKLLEMAIDVEAEVSTSTDH